MDIINKKTIKIALIGLGGVGKTSFLKKLQDDIFIKNYIPTLGKKNTSIVRGNIVYDITEFAGQECYHKEMTKPLEYFDRIICMVDDTKVNYILGLKYHDRINTTSIPTIFVRAKDDIQGGYKSGNSRITHYMSVKTGNGIEELLEKLVI